MHGERSNLFYLMDTPTHSGMGLVPLGMDAVWVQIAEAVWLLQYWTRILEPLTLWSVYFIFIFNLEETLHTNGR